MFKKHCILLIDDEKCFLSALKLNFVDEGYEIITAESGRTGIHKFMGEPDRFSVVVVDYHLAEMKGSQVISELLAVKPSAQIIALSGDSSPEAFASVIDAGVVSFCQKGGIDQIIKLNRLVKKCCDTVQSLNVCIAPPGKTELADRIQKVGMIGASSELAKVVDRIMIATRSSASVLIRGETGVGKEVAAKAIHNNSARSTKPFVAVNCAAIPENLIESELFGHKKGAFTDARYDKDGYFAQAAGGTLFLDEIGDMPLTMQTKLLRVLSEKNYQRVGCSKIIKTDVRIISATNVDLQDAITKKQFRLDLLYRIDAIELEIPRLSERPDDIEALVLHFAAEFSIARAQPLRFRESAMRVLRGHNWPGNIRELRNVVERLSATLGETVSIVEARDIDIRRPKHLGQLSENANLNLDYSSFRDNQHREEKAFFEKYISESGSLRKASKEHLLLSPSTAHSRLKTLNTRIEEFELLQAMDA